MGLSESLFALWMSMGVGQTTELPKAWIPEEVGVAKLQKVEAKMRSDDELPAMAVTSRVWDSKGGPSECLMIVNEAQHKWAVLVNERETWRHDVDLFNLTHELGHCADRRKKPSSQNLEEAYLENKQREAFASGFAACLMTKVGHRKVVRDIGEAMKSTVPGTLGRDQQKAIRAAMNDPLCNRTAEGEGSSEKLDFEEAWSVAAKIDQQMYGDTSLEVSFESFMQKRRERETLTGVAATAGLEVQSVPRQQVVANP